MSASNYLENALAGHIFHGTTYTPPTELHIALFTTLPDEADSGGVEPSAASYARVAYAPGTERWSAPTSGDGKTANLYAVTFPSPTEDWGEIAGFGIYDENGNLLILEQLLANKNVLAGNPAPEFNPGSLSVTFA